MWMGIRIKDRSCQMPNVDNGIELVFGSWVVEGVGVEGMVNVCVCLTLCVCACTHPCGSMRHVLCLCI